MPTTTIYDDILWHQYRTQPPRSVPANIHAPRNYVELAAAIDFEADADDILQGSRSDVWSSFLLDWSALQDSGILHHCGSE